MLYGNILEMIGNTSIVRINNFSQKNDIDIYAKLEGNNPGGIIKNRIALNILEQADIDSE